MTFDPYVELGVPRDASPGEIKRAHRKRAFETHPDAGGSPEAFKATSRAVAVLSDPVKRARFDATGTIEEDAPDNDRTAAWQVIEMHLGNFLAKYLVGFDPKDDPRQLDFVEVLDFVIRDELKQAHKSIVLVRRTVETLKDIARRFSLRSKTATSDPIARGFAHRIEQNEKQISDIELGIRIREHALLILREYEFDVAQPDWANGAYAGLFRTGGTT